MKWPAATSVLVLVLLFVLAILIRVPHWLERPLGAYSDNEDAASHVLATVVAYDRVPIKEHHFVPVFTMGAGHDLWIDDLPTASRMSVRGYNYYTSWPPGTFVLAWATHKALGATPTPVSLRGLNLFLQFVSAGLLCALGYSLAKKRRSDAVTSWGAAFVASAIYIAAPEALRSHLFSFWAEQIYEPILLVQLLLFLYRERRGAIVGLFALGVVGALVDWTAYVATGGFALAFGWLYYRERARRWLVAASLMALANVVAGALLLWWFTSKVSLHELLAAQHYRAGVRTGGVGDYARLLAGYALSLGPFLFVLPLLLHLRKIPLREALDTLPDQGLLFVAAFPLLENVLLANHAASYTYDRLKGVSFVAVLFASLVSAGLVPVKPLVKATLLAAGLSLGLFATVYTVYRPPNSAALRQRKLLAELVRADARDDEIAFVNDNVRGHTLYYAGRNIVELDSRLSQPDIEARIVAWLMRRDFFKAVFYRVDDRLESVTVMRFGLRGLVSESIRHLGYGSSAHGAHPNESLATGSTR